MFGGWSGVEWLAGTERNGRGGLFACLQWRLACLASTPLPPGCRSKGGWASGSMTMKRRCTCIITSAAYVVQRIYSDHPHCHHAIPCRTLPAPSFHPLVPRPVYNPSNPTRTPHATPKPNHLLPSHRPLTTSDLAAVPHIDRRRAYVAQASLYPILSISPTHSTYTVETGLGSRCALPVDLTQRRRAL